MDYRVGAWYTLPFIGINNNSGVVVNSTRFLPFYVNKTTTFDRIGIRSGTGFSGTATVRLGIYNTTSGQPGTVKLDAGTVSVTSSDTAYNITISQSLDAGWYWLAANTTSAATANNYLFLTTNAYGGYIGSSAPENLVYSGYTQAVNVSTGFATATSLFPANSTLAVFLRAA